MSELKDSNGRMQSCKVQRATKINRQANVYEEENHLLLLKIDK